MPALIRRLLGLLLTALAMSGAWAAQPAAESAPAAVAGEESGSGEIVDVEEEITDIGGGGGTGAPPPPPSWA